VTVTSMADDVIVRMQLALIVEELGVGRDGDAAGAVRQVGGWLHALRSLCASFFLGGLKPALPQLLLHLGPLRAVLCRKQG